jgi:predicted ATP-dependent serine protease
MNLKLINTELVKVSDIDIPSRFYNRMTSGVKELDDLFGGGILPGSTFTLTATPGTGKTTFFLQLLEALQLNGYSCGFVTGEEDVTQIAFSCKRLGITHVPVCNETNIDKILNLMKHLDIIIIDSFPTLTTTKSFNSRSREKYLIESIIEAATENDCAVGIILHITKSGNYKGSTLIPHSVSANFKLERDEENESIRILFVEKNRYGCCSNLTMYFGSRGFDFSEIQTTERPKKESKADRNRQMFDAVLKLAADHGVTQKQIVKHLKVSSSKAYTLLKELSNMDELVKYGRGENAIFKKTLKKEVEV